MTTRRQERVSQRIHEEVGLLLQRRLKDPRLAQVTVTEVRVTADLKQATIFITCLGDAAAQEAAVKGMENALGFIRRELAQSLGMRFTPVLSFELDTAWERAANIDRLLDQLPPFAPDSEDTDESSQGPIQAP